MSNTEKIYCGNARIVSTQYGELTKISLSKEDINKMVAHMKGEKLEWINLVVKPKQSPQPGKPTHYLEVDTWKPTPKEEQPAQQHASQAKPQKTIVQDMEDDELPF